MTSDDLLRADVATLCLDAVGMLLGPPGPGGLRDLYDPAARQLAGLAAAVRAGEEIDPGSLTMCWDRQTIAALAASQLSRMWDVEGLADSLGQMEEEIQRWV